MVPDKNLFIIGDRTALCYQLFSNLISNAIKFSFDHSTIELIFKDEGNFVIAQVKYDFRHLIGIL